MSRVAILCVVILLFCPTGAVYAQTLTPPERSELQVYREKIPIFLKELKDLRSRVSSCEAPANQAYQDYVKQYWKQQGELLEYTRSAFLSQGTAENVILWLVVIVTVSGIVLAAYQLYVSFKIGQKIEAGTLDLSAQKAQVTSSVVGVIVLVIAGAFLMMFLKEVYGIQYVAPPSSGTQQKTP